MAARHNRERPAQAVADSDADFYVPDLCRVRAVFLLVVTSELLVLVLSIVQAESHWIDWNYFGLLSLFVQWTVLTSAALICPMRRWLSRLTVTRATTVIVTIVMLDVLAFSLFADSVLHPQPGLEAWQGVAKKLLLALLISPTVERLFGMITRSRLLELCDLQRPLLRKLSSEAPGTFEHTLMICGLAEEGVRAIGGDVDLVRTGALYHDVGKLHAPQWFIENQQGGDNPHDHLDDPWRSAEILQAHVDEGIKMARRYGLPQPVADFIPEHQGTLRMGYFWHRAKEQNPNASDRPFRYRGPKPQSKESAVMMLADGCEAALRAMPPETDETQACDGVRRIIHSRHHDGQLDDSGLGTGEIELVVRAFVKVWRRMRHRRIPYPIPARKAFSA